MNSIEAGPKDSQYSAKHQPWVEQLYRNSPLKREKFVTISSMLPAKLPGLVLLDVGGDNGVISFKLRQLGGEWSSVDVIPEAVEAIRKVVGERVFQMGESHLPFADEMFDGIVIVDMLEHLIDDQAFVAELTRVLKPGGFLVVNVPNPKEGLLRKFRFAIGQTDEKHGHVRPGYTVEQLKDLLGEPFFIERSRSYSRLFSQLVDTVVNGGLALLKAGKKGKKGTLVTSEVFQASRKNSMLLKIIGPFLSFAVLLDRLFPVTHGNTLVAFARKR